MTDNEWHQEKRAWTFGIISVIENVVLPIRTELLKEGKQEILREHTRIVEQALLPWRVDLVRFAYGCLPPATLHKREGESRDERRAAAQTGGGGTDVLDRYSTTYTSLFFIRCLCLLSTIMRREERKKQETSYRERVVHY